MLFFLSGSVCMYPGITTADHSRLSERAENVTKDEIKAVIQNADDETLSIRNLMSKQESKPLIPDAREYQMELFERAKRQDIIAVLDTGIHCETHSRRLSPLNKSRFRKDAHSCSTPQAHARPRS